MGIANRIKLYFHCAKCLKEKPADQSPLEWSRLQAGWTEKGVQVWCVRHDINVVHLDFGGVARFTYDQSLRIETEGGD